MKTNLLTINCILLVFVFYSTESKANSAENDTTFSQNNSSKIEMLFPGGKSKALILSFDDGNVADRKLVELFNKYGLFGTFHLNSNKLGTENYLKKEEIKKLFQGHEVSVHSANHSYLTKISEMKVKNEINEDRKELEKLTGNIVRGIPTLLVIITIQ